MRFPCIVLLAALSTAFAQQPMPPEQQAEVLLTAGQKAFNQGDPTTAAAKFNEVVQKFGGTRAALGAKYGLGLLQLTADNPDFGKAVELFMPAANDGGFADRGQALYQLGVCQRAVGLREVEKNKGEADKRFGEAMNSFRAAMDWFAGQKQDGWSGRSRCDLAEMLIRTGKVKDARGACEPFVKEPAFAKNKHRPLGLYYHGLACFLDKDLNAAGRSLNQLAPFTDPAFGPHARYLVGRVLHLQGESAEASVHYDAVLADHEKARAAATEAVKDPNKFKGNPFELARLRRLASGPAPEHVAGAAFHTAALKYEAGKFADSLDRFQQFAKQFDADPLAPDAALRVGLCQVQLRQFDEAAKTLPPLIDKTPRLADQAQFWLGKAEFGLAQGIDPNNPAEREKRTKAVLDTLRKAADRANGGDEDAKARRRDMLFELGDTLLTAKLPKDAAGVFEQLWNDQSRLSPLRREESLQRLAQALGEAGEFQKSDDRVAEFRRIFPNSTLTAAVVFRGAENAYSRAIDGAKKPETKQRHEEAASKFQEVAAKFPEFERVHHARLLAAVCLVQINSLDAAAKLLDAIPGPDRSGELALAAYLLGDILLRQTPTAVANDALEENKAREKLTAAVAQFDGFVSGNPQAAETPAALLKLGHCHKRLALSLVDPNERNQTFQKAREALERLRKEYAKDPLAATATLELAKVKALQGDRGGAMNDLREAMKGDAKTAPLAALHLATLLREEGKAADAEKVLADARKRFESDLEKDPERADWVPTLRFHHAAALFEQQKYADARGLFAQVTKPDMLAAEAKLRAGQCKLAEDRKAIQTAAEERNKAGNDKGKRDAAEKKYQDARNTLFQTATGLADKAPDSPARGRMCYEAAWAFRELSGEEIGQATELARKEAHAKLPPNSPWPTVPRGKVPPTRCEQQAFAAYRKLIEAAPESALAVDARFELAELLAERDDHTEAVKLLKAALDAEPTHPDLTERIRLRLGGCLFAVKDYPAAAAQFDAVAGNDKSPHRAQAAYRSGECHAAAGDWAKAIERLAPFRGKGEWHNVGGVSDRALLRLGHALLASNKPDDAKGTFETLLARFGNGNPHAADARYAIGLVHQAKGQHDEAVKAFEAVIAATQSETAAKAQLGIGHCRFAQKRYADAASAFLVVPYTYDYLEVGFAAGLEAARAFEADGKPADAEKVLTRVLKDAPADGEWHKAAKERLGKMKK